MKRQYFIKTVIIAVMALFLSSCNKSVEEATKVAYDFLESYFSINYSKAAEYCSSPIQKTLLDNQEEVDEMPDEVKGELVKMLQGAKIVFEEAEKKADGSVVFKYQIDLTNDQKPIKGSLTVSKIDDVWRVSKLK
jgi:hypothetical protein